MTLPVILDSEGLSALRFASSSSRTSQLSALLRERWQRNGEVVVPAVVCAEACRGRQRTREIESLLARHPPAYPSREPIRVIDTDFELARLVGSVLDASSSGSTDIVDAHLVAVCLQAGGGLIISSDPTDVRRLAAPFPGLRIVIRSP